MVYPKVESISSLASYAKNIHMFSDSYLEAANTSYRTYSVALSGQHGDAVQAFVDKLNTLQAQVFDQYPTALATYAQTVATYEEALTGHGFNERMWSDKSGSEKLKKLYTTGQVTEISDKVTEMNNLLKTAAEAAGVEAPDLSSIKTAAIDGFKKAGDDRGDLASDIDSKWKTFTETLTNNAETIKAFQPVINNATYLSQLSLTDIANKIVNGQLSAEHMYYLNGVQSVHDSEAINILLNEANYPSEEDFFSVLGSINYADKLSGGAADVIHGRLYEEIDSLYNNGLSHSDNLGYYFQAMTTRLTKEQAEAYSKKMSEASTRFAGLLKLQGIAAVPDFGDSVEQHEKHFQGMKETAPLFRNIDQELTKASLLGNVFDYIYSYNLGFNVSSKMIEQDPTSNYRNISYNVMSGSGIDAQSLNFDFTKGTVDFVVSKGAIKEALPFTQYYSDPWGAKPGYPREQTKVHIDKFTTQNQGDMREVNQRIRRLQKDKDKAEKDMYANIAVSATGEIPYVAPVIEVMKKALYDKDEVNLGDAGDKIPVFKTVKGIYDNVVKYKEKLKSIDSDISRQQSKFYDKLFDTSGVSVDQGSGKEKVYSNRTYDLQSALMQYDLQENGLQSYIYTYERSNFGAHEAKTPEEANRVVEYFNRNYKKNSDAGLLLRGKDGIKIEDGSKSINGDGKISAQDAFNELDNFMKENFDDLNSYDDYKTWQDFYGGYYRNLVSN